MSLASDRRRAKRPPGAGERAEEAKQSLLGDAVWFAALTGKALSQDEFSKCFQQKIARHERISATPAYVFGIVARYMFLVPCRLLALLALLTPLLLSLFLVGILTNNRALKNAIIKLSCKTILMSAGMRVSHFGKKPRLAAPHVFVANHTTYMDYIALSSHVYSHSVIAQRHQGVMGFLMNLLQGSLQFDRRSRLHRSEVKSKLAELAERGSVLVFPEGTCVNNEYTVMFQKGAFELGVPVCPVAIKYNKSLGDPYWSTRTQSFSKHFFYVMSRWRTEASVWWLEPCKIKPGETPAEFACRIKSLISERAKLKNLVWNGYLKNCSDPEQIARLREKGLGEKGQLLRLLSNT